MKIILVVTGAKDKNVVFVSDALQVYSLDESVRLARDGKFEGVYAVSGKHGTYLRTRPRVRKNDELEKLSVSSHQLFAYANDTRNALSTPALARFIQLYEHTLEKDGGPLIITYDKKGKTTKEAAMMKLQPHRELIFSATKKFAVDPYLLGAIIIDEIARFAPWEPITDPLFGYILSINASAGIAQVKLNTARGLIRNGYYNPNPDDLAFSPQKIGKVSRRTLYEYIKQPKHSIFFAAARMRELADRWKRFVDLDTMPEIVATLYHLPDAKKSPHAHPQSNERGSQIADEFYKLTKVWLP